VQSNEVQFEVTELDNTDEQILDLYRQNKYDNRQIFSSIIQNYPDNPFAEHVHAEYLIDKHLFVHSSLNYKGVDELESDYKEFIKKYPNSSYLLIDKFVEPYIYKHFIGMDNLKDNINSDIEDFREANDDNMLKYFLKDKRRVKVILRLE